MQVLLSVLARVGHDSELAAAGAVAQGARAFGLPDTAILPADRCSFELLDRALISLREAAPDLKRHILDGAAACIAADREVRTSEVELLRAVSASIGCPMPPVL
jgi:hypothetical protein